MNSFIEQSLAAAKLMKETEDRWISEVISALGCTSEDVTIERVHDEIIFTVKADKAHLVVAEWDKAKEEFDAAVSELSKAQAQLDKTLTEAEEFLAGQTDAD